MITVSMHPKRDNIDLETLYTETVAPKVKDDGVRIVKYIKEAVDLTFQVEEWTPLSALFRALTYFEGNPDFEFFIELT